MQPKDHLKSKAPKYKTRVRPTSRGEFMAYSFFGYYVGYGSSIESAVLRHRKILCELT
uniref:Uncharacterized protein n=1 Tax=Pseudomonas phage HRDY3 TaxID=3236930 RepID=A0AB39CE79_9VIRU